MKLKLRFKKALFAFFKDEIMRTMGYLTDDVWMQNIQVGPEVKCIKASILLDETRERIEINEAYDEALHTCRSQLFHEVMNHVIVDSSSVMDPHVRGIREIRVRLYITKPQQP